jgi:hypothetical protein
MRGAMVMHANGRSQKEMCAWVVHACTEEMMTCKQAENEQLVKERKLN